MSGVDYQSFDQWQFRGGDAGDYGTKLTQKLLYEWSVDPKARLMCVFCGTLVSTTSRYCSRCREYKGLQPAIVGWSVPQED